MANMRMPVPTVNIHYVSPKNHSASIQGPEHIALILAAIWGPNTRLDVEQLPVDAPDNTRYVDLGSVGEELSRLHKIYGDAGKAVFPDEDTLAKEIIQARKKDLERAKQRKKVVFKNDTIRENPEFAALGFPPDVVEILARNGITKVVDIPDDPEKFCEVSGCTPSFALDILETVARAKNDAEDVAALQKTVKRASKKPAALAAPEPTEPAFI